MIHEKNNCDNLENENKLLRASLEEYKKKVSVFKEIEKLASFGFWELEIQENKLKWSDEIYIIFGCTPQEFEATYESFLSFVHPDDRQYVNNSYTKHLETKKEYNIVHRILSRNGELKYVNERCSSVFDANDKPIRSIGTVTDVTELNFLHNTLKESELKFKTVADYTYDWEYWLSPDNNFVYCSPACERITGYSPIDFLNNSDLLNQIIHKEDFGIFDKHYTQVCECKITDEIDFRITTKHNEIRWINHICQPIYDNNNIYIGIRGSNRDITDRKNIEIQLENSNRELIKLNSDKDRFITILGHDLKSPFTTILGFISLLSDNLYKYDIKKIEQYLNILSISATNTFNLLEDLLLWAMAQSGNMPFEPKEIEITLLCEEVAANLEAVAEKKNIEIKIYSTEEIIIFVDVNMIKTILRNLLSNAIKFTNENGLVQIFLERNKKNTIITVSDNGVGMNSESIEKLWNFAKPFTREGTNQEKGTGLGLLICKEFVEKHGGKLQVNSQIGTGSDFIFNIPDSGRD